MRHNWRGACEALNTAKDATRLAWRHVLRGKATSTAQFPQFLAHSAIGYLNGQSGSEERDVSRLEALKSRGVHYINLGSVEQI